MKKLNSKGFTLIELLAIIVILAIIMVVTIPTVLSSMGNARSEMFQTSVNTVADWVEKQYTLTALQTYEAAFAKICTTTNNYCVTEYNISSASDNSAIADADAKAFLKAAGVDPKNYTGMYVKVTDGRACIKLTASSDGKFSAYKGTENVSTGC